MKLSLLALLGGSLSAASACAVPPAAEPHLPDNAVPSPAFPHNQFGHGHGHSHAHPAPASSPATVVTPVVPTVTTAATTSSTTSKASPKTTTTSVKTTPIQATPTTSTKVAPTTTKATTSVKTTPTTSSKATTSVKATTSAKATTSVKTTSKTTSSTKAATSSAAAVKSGLSGKATTTRYYDGQKGACGCGTDSGLFSWQLGIATGVYTAAGSEAFFDPTGSTWCGSGCGKCYKLTSTGDSACSTCGAGGVDGQSIIVMVSNLCPYNGNEQWCPAVGDTNDYGYSYHFDIMAQNEVFGDNVVVDFEEVTCPSAAISDFSQCECA